MANKQLIKRFEQLSHRHALFTVWSDFLQLSAIALSNAVDLREPARSRREEAYLQTIKKYSKEEATELSLALAEVVAEMENGPSDVLGQVYMALELGNKWTGQFFTPDALCQVMAAMLVDEQMHRTIAEVGYITVQEPAVGGGAMVIGLVNAMLGQKLNPQQQMHVTAVDVDIKSVHMAYIQLTLLHIPAVIVHGNTLSAQAWDHWYTPAHILDGWGWRLRAAEARRARQPAVAEPAPIDEPPPALPAQGDLFQEAA